MVTLAVMGDRMDDLSRRVRQVRQELGAIAEQLNRAAPEVTRANLVPDPGVADDLLALKAAIDEMRAFLWAYFEAVRQAQLSADPGTPTAGAGLNDDSPGEDSQTSFFEQVQTLATTVVDKHMMGIR